jgi:hypothetical protein
LTVGRFMLWLLYCLPLCLRVARGVVHVVVAILSTITVYCLTEGRFMLLLHCLSLLFKVLQRSWSCCCYFVYHYCLRFDIGVVHVVLVGYSIYHFCLRFDRGVVHVVLVGYIVYHYCFRFDKGVVHFFLVILSTITA